MKNQTSFKSVFSSRLAFFIYGCIVWHFVQVVLAQINLNNFCAQYPDDEICLVR